VKKRTTLAAVVAVAASTLGVPIVATGDCILNAKSKTSYVILDSHTILLKGGIGNDILIKSFAFFNTASQVTVLKDSFCDFETAVLYVDGQTVDAQQVKGL
jgi:hypothetical protein